MFLTHVLFGQILTLCMWFLFHWIAFFISLHLWNLPGYRHLWGSSPTAFLPLNSNFYLSKLSWHRGLCIGTEREGFPSPSKAAWLALLRIAGDSLPDPPCPLTVRCLQAIAFCQLGHAAARSLHGASSAAEPIPCSSQPPWAQAIVHLHL